ncbi:unnamed protein product [Nippostrongylus brasiliensis]|uniref:Zmiz1_N domain-containing protein n=1 Tax=Nippostrongylus brasiliensis TaxID=27835 RepID=A0A0N4YPN5_NIPBR|nr:unnamed protein product [Nippostrongylus brasiliensis]
MTEDISYEEHVQQNNQRLISIRASLMEERTFPSACAELTQWCSDQRAFSTYFEDNLLSALQVAVENGTKDGFDFTLAHQLISACFTHRKLLSKNSACELHSSRSLQRKLQQKVSKNRVLTLVKAAHQCRINRWYEQFRRLKKSGGKRKRKLEPPSSHNTTVAGPLPVDPSMETVTVTDRWHYCHLIIPSWNYPSDFMED